MRKTISDNKWIKKSLIVFFCLFVSYIMFYHHTESYEWCITRNVITGEMKPDQHSGFHFTAPWVLASKIDTRPRKVCIASASRNMNCRLVQFDTTYWKELVQYEGFHYYWWYNRISFNGSQETYRGVDNLLLGHAYGATRGKFVKILQEVGAEQ